MNLPYKFREKMQGLMSEDTYRQLIASYSDSMYKGIRINTLKAGVEEVQSLPFKTEPVSWCSAGFYIDNAVRPGKNPFYYAGLYYVQEPTAMAASEALEVTPGDWVLDLCAAPGGKSTQLASALKGKGLLVSNELINSRVGILNSNLERMGVSNSLTLNEFPERLITNFYESFDKILVDAPCSGEGMFRKEPGELKAWSQERVLRCSEKQKKIIDTVYKLLKPGGIMVYSTCTFSPEENEQIIDYFVTKYDDMKILPLHLKEIHDHGRPEWTLTNNPEMEKTLRLMPYQVKGEGHFIAKLKKDKQSEAKRKSFPVKTKQKSAFVKAKPQDLAAFKAFAKEYLVNFEMDRIYLLNQSSLYRLPEGITPEKLTGLRVVNAGVWLGNNRKNRFEPSHTLGMTLKKDAFNQCYEVKDEEEANTYLKGETISLSHQYKGWVLVTIKNYPLGFGKATGGVLKNHYPKGLRIYKK